MISQWNDWLRQLATAGQGGVVAADAPITRGLSYDLVLPFPADFSADDFKASLKIAPDSVSSLADFAVSVGAYADGFTTVTLSLTKEQVGALPADSDGNGVEEVLFDLLHTPSGGAQYRLMGLSLPITGAITDAD